MSEEPSRPRRPIRYVRRSSGAGMGAETGAREPARPETQEPALGSATGRGAATWTRVIATLILLAVVALVIWLSMTGTFSIGR